MTQEQETVFVSGEPALLLSRGERAWRETVGICGLSGLAELRLQFVVSSWRRGGNFFDLDNLVDPVLAVVAARPADRRSLWATVEVGDAPGVHIAECMPPHPPEIATTVHLGDAPRRSVRTVDRLAELVDAVVVGTDEPCGCSLTLGGNTTGLVFGFEGAIKPTLDALWPLLGGDSHSPADHRIRDLRVVFDRSTEGVLVSLWPMHEGGRG